MDYGIYVEGIF